MKERLDLYSSNQGKAMYIAAIVFGVIGVAAAIWEAVISLKAAATMAMIEGRIGTMALAFQLVTPAAMALLAFMAARLAGGPISDGTAKTSDLRGLNTTSLVASLMIYLLVLTGADEFSHTVMAFVTTPDSSLPEVCMIACFLVSLLGHAALVAIVVGFVSINRTLRSGQTCACGAASRILLSCLAGGQAVISLLYAVCCVIAMGGRTAVEMNPTIGCRWAQSLALTVLLFVFVLCWQKFRAMCAALTESAADTTSPEPEG